MQTIRGMGFEKGRQFVVMNPAGQFFTCSMRPSVRQDKSGEPMPRYDERTNAFVCGSDTARAALRELLTHVLVTREQPIPGYVMDCPLLGAEVAEWEKEWRSFAAEQGLNGETLSEAAA